MPAANKTQSKTRRKTKKNYSLSASRLLKTKGKFSKGKLATIVITFAAIGALVISLTHAWSYQDIVNWQQAQYGWMDRGGGQCADAYGGCTFDLHNFASGHIIWWGPYHRLGVPSPTGMNDQVCANLRMNGAGYVTFGFDISALNGSVILQPMTGNQEYAFRSTSNSGTGFQLICKPVHIPPSYAGYWDGVEYRIRFIELGYYQGKTYPSLVIGQVGFFQ